MEGLKGTICYTPRCGELEIYENSWLFFEKGTVAGVFRELPEELSAVPVRDYGDRLILPGLIDLHAHAPQYPFRGLGMDLELLDWLNTHTFPEEAKYADPAYAEAKYRTYVQKLKKSAVTRVCLFGTIHVEATELLMDLLEQSGLCSFVGKVNMDRNSPEELREPSAEASAGETRRWLEEISGKYRNTAPILTPRFIPSCSDELMEKLSALQKTYHLPIQSHLSENPEEIAWVQELCPWSSCYGDAYRRFQLFGGEVKTIMAHCVHSSDEEIQLMRERGVFVAHCPESNGNLSSGIAPVRRYLREGIPVGLGTDVAAGSGESIFRAMALAIQMSKMRWRYLNQNEKPLSMEEALYLGTRGGGSFWGRVGSFEPGFEMDAVVIDDSAIRDDSYDSARERLERVIYLDGECALAAKYVRGKQIEL